MPSRQKLGIILDNKISENWSQNKTAAFLFFWTLSKMIWTSQKFDLPRIIFDQYLEDWDSIFFLYTCGT